MLADEDSCACAFYLLGHSTRLVAELGTLQRQRKPAAGIQGALDTDVTARPACKFPADCEARPGPLVLAGKVGMYLHKRGQVPVSA